MHNQSGFSVEVKLPHIVTICDKEKDTVVISKYAQAKSKMKHYAIERLENKKQ